MSCDRLVADMKGLELVWKRQVDNIIFDEFYFLKLLERFYQSKFKYRVIYIIVILCGHVEGQVV